MKEMAILKSLVVLLGLGLSILLLSSCLHREPVDLNPEMTASHARLLATLKQYCETNPDGCQAALADTRAMLHDHMQTMNAMAPYIFAPSPPVQPIYRSAPPSYLNPYAPGSYLVPGY